MAIFVTIHCPDCNQDKEVQHGVMGARTPTICAQCAEKKESEKRAKDLAELAKLPIEERLARLEARMYDHDNTPHYSGHILTGGVSAGLTP